MAFQIPTNMQHMPPSPYQQSSSSSTVPYSGQWTKEEQDYVSVLVEGFKNGSLDIPDGTSLRFFIAAKLGCKPKRVSKKYERSGYNGKQVYRRDTSISDEKQKEYSARLKDHEKKFKESRALVVSMQEAKSTDTSSSATRAAAPQAATAPVMNPNVQALEERLIAMRSQLDRRTAGMFGGAAHHQQLSSSRFNTPAAGMLGPLNSPLASAPVAPDVLDAFLMNRRGTNPATGFINAGGFTATNNLLSQTTPGVSPPATKKLLLDLYKRRQQLVMATAVMAGTANPSAPVATPDPYMMMQAANSNPDATSSPSFAAMNANSMMNSLGATAGNTGNSNGAMASSMPMAMMMPQGHKRALEPSSFADDQQQQQPLLPPSPESPYKRARAA